MSKFTCGNAPHGVSGVINFSFEDIWISNSLYALLDEHICLEIEECLCKMEKDDYGFIDEEMRERNGENRYLGNCKDIIGKYQISIGSITISMMPNYTYIEFAKEGN